MFPGTVMLGGVVSTTETENDPDPALPPASTAEQCTVVAPSGNVEPLGGVQVIATGPSTRSYAEAEYETDAPAGPVASAVMLDGRERVGGVVSTTVTVKPADALLPASSVAVHETLVGPSGNVDPEAGVQTGVTDPSTRSLAVAEKETLAPDGPVASAVIPPGTVRAGGVVSTTLIVKLPVALLPATSDAAQLTTVEPTGNVDPLAGEQCTVIAPSTTSEADAV